jgi:DNA/RNA-binding domain of Phe-tRNA-synthetase-like protein
VRIAIHPDIAIKVGFLHLTACRITESSDALLGIFDETVNEVRQRFADSPINQHPVAGGVRRLFKSVGIDPTRYRPSGEALVRRVLKDQALNHINSIVDINNICSMESLFPVGVYDQERIMGDVNIRIGTRDDVYFGIERSINIDGKLVSADDQGAFGSPIADSDRTKVTESTQSVLVLLYAPESIDAAAIHSALNRFANLANEHAGAQTVDWGVSASHQYQSVHNE